MDTLDAVLHYAAFKGIADNSARLKEIEKWQTYQARRMTFEEIIAEERSTLADALLEYQEKEKGYRPKIISAGFVVIIAFVLGVYSLISEKPISDLIAVPMGLSAAAGCAVVLIYAIKLGAKPEMKKTACWELAEAGHAEEEHRDNTSPVIGDRFSCPECGESISMVAKHCRFCQAVITERDRPKDVLKKSVNARSIAQILIVGLLLLTGCGAKSAGDKKVAGLPSPKERMDYCISIMQSELIGRINRQALTSSSYCVSECVKKYPQLEKIHNTWSYDVQSNWRVTERYLETVLNSHETCGIAAIEKGTLLMMVRNSGFPDTAPKAERELFEGWVETLKQRTGAQFTHLSGYNP